MGKHKQGVPPLDVAKAHYGYETRRRLPWILLAVVAGSGMVWLGQAYGGLLSERIHLVFFIPMIVYMSDSIGTETLALFVRELALKRLDIRHVIFKESLVGLSLGLASGIPMGALSYLWFGDLAVAASVATAMTANGLVAVLVGMLVPAIFAKLGKDPALGTDEITTALSDNISMLVYFAVSTVILLRL